MLRWILALLGFIYSGFILALIGFFVGAAFDRSLSLGTGAINPFSAAARQQSFLRTLFTLMGALAKSDGHISRDEINQVEHFMAQMGMTADHRQQAIAYFKEGAALNGDIDALLTDFKRCCGHTRNLNQVLMTYLITVALADGVVHAGEKALLGRIAQSLGFSLAELEQLLAMSSAQDHFAPGANASEATLEEAYRALGVGASVSDKELKRAYRKQMSKYHPG